MTPISSNEFYDQYLFVFNSTLMGSRIMNSKTSFFPTIIAGNFTFYIIHC